MAFAILHSKSGSVWLNSVNFETVGERLLTTALPRLDFDQTNVFECLPHRRDAGLTFGGEPKPTLTDSLRGQLVSGFDRD